MQSERGIKMKELELKYGCNPNQKPSRIYMEEGELPIKVLNGKPGYINFLDAFNIPVLTLVNVTGFAATVEEEKTISKALAKLTNAYADATVPKVTVVMDKAYGTAYTVMNSKAIGADMVYAWPDAVIGTMDPEMAVKIMYEDELAAADDKLAFIKEKKAEYVAALSGAASAASRGYIDDIIEPDATRKRVIAAIQMLLSKEEMRPYKKHSTI